jgi:hypothetical protein
MARAGYTGLGAPRLQRGLLAAWCGLYFKALVWEGIEARDQGLRRADVVMRYEYRELDPDPECCSSNRREIRDPSRDAKLRPYTRA